MRPLSALQRRQMQQRRTCTDCGKVFLIPAWGMCGVCRDREARRLADLHWRVCQDCGTVFQTPAPAGICGICSVNDVRGQAGSRHHQRRLCHKNSGPRSP